MMLGRALTGLAPMKASYSKRRMSDEKITFRRKRVKVTAQPRPIALPDVKRPPFLLVKSFFNLRHLNNENDAKHVSQATEDLSFKPHRTLLVGNKPYLPVSEQDDWNRSHATLLPNPSPEEIHETDPQPNQESDPLAETT